MISAALPQASHQVRGGRGRKIEHRRGNAHVTPEKGQPVAATRNVSGRTELEEGNAQPCRHLELKQAMLTRDFSHQN